MSGHACCEREERQTVGLPQAVCVQGRVTQIGPQTWIRSSRVARDVVLAFQNRYLDSQCELIAGVDYLVEGKLRTYVWTRGLPPQITLYGQFHEQRIWLER
jgi:hypothetical protein